ncbi:MAG: SGNH/GDSL hydrolase family protein [Planctomycetota bacterium]|nr:SGNH/GDSL hydrolase family protein [Planctomycetota bacterium]
MTTSARTMWSTLLVALTLAGAGSAQERPTAPETVRPRVLLLGDQSLSNHLDRAAQALKDEASVVRSPLGHLSSGAALARIEEILGEERWDLVCFHFGLSDLMFRDPRSEQVRAMSPAAGGVPVTPIERFPGVLARFVDRLRAAGASRLLWVTSVPLHPSRRSAAIDADKIPVYGEAAKTVMREHAVPIFDAHAQVAALLEEAPDPRSLDRFHNQLYGKDLSGPLVERMRELLGSPPQPAERPSTSEPEKSPGEPRERD